MELKISSQEPNFKAKMQLRGNIRLLKNEQAQSLKSIIEKIGLKSDIIDINLPQKVAPKGVVHMAGYINGALEQFKGKYKNFDVYSGILNGLDKVKDIFPTVATVIGGVSVVNEIANNDNTSRINEAAILTSKLMPKSYVSDAVYKESVINFLKRKVELAKEDFEYFLDINDPWNKDYNIKNSKLIQNIRNVIKNDPELEKEYCDIMKNTTYYVYYSDSAKYYTGDDAKDCTNEDWVAYATRAILRIIKSNPETKSRILDKTCEMTIQSYLAKRDLTKDIIQQAEDDMFRAEWLGKFEDFWDDMEQAEQENVNLEKHLDLIDSMCKYFNKKGWLDPFEQRYGYTRLAKEVIYSDLEDPEKRKRIVKEWLDYKLACRTTVEERLMNKMSILSFSTNSKIDKVAKEMLSENDVKNIVKSETADLRRTVNVLDEKLFPTPKKLSHKDIEYLKKKEKGDFLDDFHNAIASDTERLILQNQLTRSQERDL